MDRDRSYRPGRWRETGPTDPADGERPVLQIRQMKSGPTDPVDGGLAAARRTDEHDSVAHKHRLVELDDLVHLSVHDLQPPHHPHALYLRLQAAVVVRRDLNVGEQVL